MADQQKHLASNRERRRAQNQSTGIHYNVLKCTAIDKQLGIAGKPHYQVHVITGTDHHRIAINVQSEDGSEVLYYVNENFTDEMLDELSSLPVGYTALSPDSPMALDYVRGNLFDHTQMVPLPMSDDGTGNDLNDKIDHYISKAIDETDAMIYAFGDKWGPEDNVPDPYFNFTPGSGIHDIHMNQGNYDPQFQVDNGIFHDGGLFIYYPSENRWVAIFLAFQSQSFDTDQNGVPKDYHNSL